MPYIFGNGRVILVEQKTINEAINLEKEILIICNAWSGGYARAIGAKKSFDSDFSKCWNMYSYNITNKELKTPDLDKFYRVIISSGEEIWMQTGAEATSYYSNINAFIDWASSEETIISRTNCSSDEIYKMRKAINPNATVNNLNCKYIEGPKPDYADWEERVWALINVGILPEDSVKYVK